MKIIAKTTLSTILLSSLAFAQTTMCFKENHTSITTIETIPLDGGFCASNKSVIEMKKEGWRIDDIKIEKSTSGNNYIYIFKKDSTVMPAFNQEELEQKLLIKLENKKKEEEKTKKIEIMKEKYSLGEKLYIKKCQTCHGEKGELEYGTARVLNTLSQDEYESAIKGYRSKSYDRGQAIIMSGYATNMSSNDIKNTHLYLQTLNKKDK